MEDVGCIYTPTKHHSYWLVAHNLRGYRHVHEDDMEAIAEEKGNDTD